MIDRRAVNFVFKAHLSFTASEYVASIFLVFFPITRPMLGETNCPMNKLEIETDETVHLVVT